MSSRNYRQSVGGFFSMLGSAIAAAGAVESSRMPRSRDLQALGIDPSVFRGIHRLR